MVFARLAEYFSGSQSEENASYNARHSDLPQLRMEDTFQKSLEEEEDIDAMRPPYTHVGRQGRLMLYTGLTLIRLC